MKKEIKFPAICTVHTPSGPTYCCEKHAIKVQALFNHLGCHVNIDVLFEDQECKNCINEAKKGDAIQ